ncbi:spermidine/putrescine ABC transporter ATPase (plasmid) [Azospirillum argentinense]|uniref:Spermidine/putrescine ABC transporter ATPase n=1 Tax=Azospirillum argentinense TaxID=2970906 RepID=A0A060DVP3_9PROT|nr:ABC transporter ATP-binding protein [Azospirillum argentinense]AIB14949.1 spermidine/putrescine ABC transporter ATPase [Azospirillum argentinense]EZQ04444.1 spermidine/putrescine ABC transporter ATPase [Azospirillum argentinense]
MAALQSARSHHQPPPQPATEATAKPAGVAVTLDGITHRFGASTAVDNVTLEIKAGELVALLGPSGCGKTTLLRILAGFQAQTLGRVVIGDRVVDSLPPAGRGVGIVFQNYALFPHMTVAQNVAYGLEARGAARDAVRARVEAMLSLVKLDAMRDRFPKQLSGGQQQRVALARALAIQPSILLLDEPFAALDKNLRLDMQIEIKQLQRRFGITTIMVTHDQEEALSMADRIAVLSRGKLEQFGTPEDVYDRPGTLFVNGFVGSANQLRGRVVRASGSVAEVALEAGTVLTAVTPDAALAAGDPAILCVRPENLRLATEAAPQQIAGTVELALPLGPVVVYEVRTADGGQVKVTEPRVAGAALRAPGTPVRLQPVSPQTCRAFAVPAGA